MRGDPAARMCAMGMPARVGPGYLVPKPTYLQLRVLSAHWRLGPALAQSSKERGVPVTDWLTRSVSSRLLSCGTSAPSAGVANESIVFYSEC